MRLLAISGSLRAASLNTMVLRAAAVLAPEGVEVIVSDAIGKLPHFNPDLDAEGMKPPREVAALRSRIAAVDGLLISTPEYAHGLPGVLKNALDWLVSSIEFLGKPVAILNTSSRATYAMDSLLEILKTMNATVVADACVSVPLIGGNLDLDSIVIDPQASARIRDALAKFASAIAERPHTATRAA